MLQEVDLENSSETSSVLRHRPKTLEGCTTPGKLLFVASLFRTAPIRRGHHPYSTSPILKRLVISIFTQNKEVDCVALQVLSQMRPNTTIQNFLHRLTAKGVVILWVASVVETIINM